MTILSEKIIEVIRSVIPTMLVVILVHIFSVNLPMPSFFAFLIGSVLIMMGLTIFLLGVDLALVPIGENMGKGIAWSNKTVVLVVAGLILGFFISAAEPSLTVLGNQIENVTNHALPSLIIVLVVSVGIALMIIIGLLRIVSGWSILPILTIVYSGIFVLAFFTSSEFLALSFDASGATTGSVTVPFLLALSTGIANLKKDTKRSEEDGFGLVAIASTGAILAVMLLNVISPVEEISGSLSIAFLPEEGLASIFFQEFVVQIGEVLLSLSPIVLLFILYQFLWLKLPKRRIRKIMIGVVYVFLGLVLFLTGVNAGLMNVGSYIGYALAEQEAFISLSLIGFCLGLVSILAEPAVSVLTQQIGQVTSGAIKPYAVLATLSVGVGLAILLSSFRLIFPWLELWHVLLPGYLLSLGLSYFVPKIFVGIAFDAGGVASGPMTATFILAFIQGAAEAVPHANILSDGFGMIALVALMPILTLQLFGLRYRMKTK